MKNKYRVAFVGAGGIARAHGYALSVLPYYYHDVPEVKRIVVASKTPESREAFAARYGFDEAVEPDELFARSDIDAVFILSPNEFHSPQLKKALFDLRASRIFVEKPIVVSREEAHELSELKVPADRFVQTGFQFLQMSAIRRALRWWREDGLGDPIHFHCRYLHSGYLEKRYRQERQWRLKPSTEGGGALVDLGSHAVSLLIAFLGKELEVLSAKQSGFFEDVPQKSDLCTTVLLSDQTSGAVGSLVASRISAGAGDLLELDIRGTQGSLRFSTEQPDVLEIFNRTGQGHWESISCGSDYQPATGFPSPKVPGGWLRSLVHAHYLFFGGKDDSAFIPDLDHALAVQRFIHCAIEKKERDR